MLDICGTLGSESFCYCDLMLDLVSLNVFVVLLIVPLVLCTKVAWRSSSWPHVPVLGGTVGRWIFVCLRMLFVFCVCFFLGSKKD